MLLRTDDTNVTVAPDIKVIRPARPDRAVHVLDVAASNEIKMLSIYNIVDMRGGPNWLYFGIRIAEEASDKSKNGAGFRASAVSA